MGNSVEIPIKYKYEIIVECGDLQNYFRKLKPKLLRRSSPFDESYYFEWKEICGTLIIINENHIYIDPIMYQHILRITPLSVLYDEGLQVLISALYNSGMIKTYHYRSLLFIPTSILSSADAYLALMWMCDIKYLPED